LGPEVSRRGSAPAAEKVMQAGPPLAIIVEDVEAILTSGEVISEKVGVKLENADISLGQACKVVVTKDETTVVDGAGKVEQISGGSTRSATRSPRSARPDSSCQGGVGPTPTMESPSGTPCAAERPRRRM
jgi:hypothetical protein